MKDKFTVVIGDKHFELLEKITTYEYIGSDSLETLCLEFDFLKNASGLLVSFGKERKDAKLFSYVDRFDLYMSRYKYESHKALKPHLVFLSIIGILLSYLLITFGHFNFLIGTGQSFLSSLRKDSTPDSILPVIVGHNIYFASKLLPFSLDCKKLAFTYKFIFMVLGYKSNIVIGLSEEPFVAHMWCVSGNMILGEVPEVSDEFQVIYNSLW